MSPTPPTGDQLTKFLTAVKDLPAWLLSGMAVAFALILSVAPVRQEMPRDFRPWLWIGFVSFSSLSLFKWLALATIALRAARAASRARRTFILFPKRANWSVSKQADDSLILQIDAQFSVKVIGSASVGLMAVRVVRPRLRGEVVHAMVTVLDPRTGYHGTPRQRDYRIEPGLVAPVHAHVFIRRGAPRPEHEDLPITLAVIDDEGNEQKVKVVCKGRPKSSDGTLAVKIEAIHAITDPIEQQVASILQAELSRYDKNGRSAGGLGSMHMMYNGQPMTSFGGDSWTPNSPANQDIKADPEHAELRSDNLAALLSVYEKFQGDSERQRFAGALLARLDEAKGYARVAYLVIASLWRMGELEAALEAAKFGLNENDMKQCGISNALMFFNGMLRFRHVDFAPADLDALERFLSDSEERPFQIPQKIAAVRAIRATARTPVNHQK